MQLDAYETTFKNEDSYWWYTARREIILSLRRRYARTNGIGLPLALNIGCGTGGLTHDLKKQARVVSLDREPEALRFCRTKELRGLVCADGHRLPVRSSSCDEIYALDCLEHLEDDQAGAREMWRVLKPKTGVAVVTVPAFPFLWNKMDEIAHHYRRYRLSSFRRLLNEAGFRVEKLSYYNFFLFPLALIHKLTEKRSNKSKSEAFLPSLPRPVNLGFKKIFAVEKFFLPYLRFPCGLSLIAILRKD